MSKSKANGPGYSRPFLKWPGNKYHVLAHILKALPAGRRLVEPFVGSGAVFLNTDYNDYLISDVNEDLIHLFLTLKEDRNGFIDYAQEFFTAKNNTTERYYELRDRFNCTTDRAEKSALFLYLNKHGYNGLMRYNKKRKFNTPFGRYRRPYFPREEMRRFEAKAQRAQFVCLDFKQAMARARRGNVCYADPPFVPLSATANFTTYSANGFTDTDQQALAAQARRLAERGVAVLISNHDTPFTTRIYKGAKFTKFRVQRFISCKGNGRGKARELLALFQGSA